MVIKKSTDLDWNFRFSWPAKYPNHLLSIGCPELVQEDPGLGVWKKRGGSKYQNSTAL